MQNIKYRNIVAGTILQESELTRLFQISRVSVSRAIQRLVDEGLIYKRKKQGFVCAGAFETETKLKLERMEIDDRLVPTLLGTPTWKSVYNQVEDVLFHHMPFGRFKIVESAMANHFEVNRSVIHSVIAHLCERGLAEKRSQSQCHSFRYDRKFVQHRYEIRIALEPAALLYGAPYIDRQFIESSIDTHDALALRIDHLDSGELLSAEKTLHLDLLNKCPNPRLLEVLRASQLPLLTITKIFHSLAGQTSDLPAVEEHLAILKFMNYGSFDLAAIALRSHLEQSMTRRMDEVPLLLKANRLEKPSFLKPA